MVTRLEFLHNNNFIHRDMKPDNFITREAFDNAFTVALAGVASGRVIMVLGDVNDCEGIDGLSLEIL